MTAVVSAFSLVSLAKIRAIIGMSMMLVIASCASSDSREAEIAVREAEVMTAEAETARLAEEATREQAARISRESDEQEAEEAMLQVRRDRVEVRRAERERIKMQEAELRTEQATKERQVRQARQQEIAALAARRQAKMDRIAELELLILQTGNESVADEVSIMALNEAVNVAEDLLNALAMEQTKYEDTDSFGNTVEPLAKSLIAELESLKNELVRRSRSQ
jgi:Skp family chaperone for outer membrane proteins|tara:strand:- start:393 stop:1058 length:666 start_codon:yes stop_codon:yes gene_type:complete